MGLSSSFDLSRITNLENRLTTDEAVMITTNNQGRQNVPYINGSGTFNAIVSIQDPANVCWWGIMQDATLYNLAFGRFTAGSKKIEIRSYYDDLTIRTGRATGATSADFNVITNDAVNAGISSNINLMPRNAIRLSPNNAGANTQGLECLLVIATGQPAFRSINTGVSNMMLKWASNGLHARDHDDTVFEPFFGSAFNVSSHRKFKENIREFSDSVLEKVKNTPIRKYKMKEAKNNTEQIGLVFDEAPEELRSDDGETLQLYKTVSYLWKAVQELTAEVEALKGASV